ncbi:uncharacterized protein K452DRAFT_131062 [Aplosporella prunicola CBS 121167]|uniref:Uncharacterized protein n=1 Tax=Aplosporella prunicola CBS 121167 TaxID=1176127 RepID=A0A6A6BL52_9PEZI|nr:uncharacterized protein K452DRAFT_131062 [Aplosporella prunicola CBS 121167]KAF2144839.1 hypothetical protein K452DRAFT_131062 [Aplosporella prunicola CBS 121167]
MAIYPGGKSTRINSPRHLTLRHSRRIVATRQREARRLLRGSTGDDSDSGDEIDPLPPGQEKLNSFWAPGLIAGPEYQINVSQTIKSGDQTLTLEAEQDFLVDAPQFSLPEGSVHSTYPPAGYSDDHRILPHVVLTDPHLPWERLGSPKAGTNAELKAKMKLGAEPVRNRVPWLVVFSFSQDELRVPPEDLESIFHKTGVKQSSTMTVNMSIEDLWNLSNDVTTPVTDNLGPDIKDSRGDFIFVKSELFTSLFSTFDDNGKRNETSGPNTTQYQYLAHVRKINGSGMALAGVEDTAVFSVVVGNRSGPLDSATPTTMCVHLVSIEGVEDMAIPVSQKYVALCSLHSWNYTVLPPNTLNVPDAFEHLGKTLNVLRAPESIIEPLRKSEDDVPKRVVSRLEDGYTLTKYRTQTGEATVGMYRGPLTPTYVPPLEALSNCSNSGVDLQILDKETGIMDLTYSVAWNVGRTMALGDEAFTAALVRLRNTIHTSAVGAAKLQTIKKINESGFRTRKELLEDLPDVMKSLAAIHVNGKNTDGEKNDGDDPTPPEVDQPPFSPGGPRKRWFRQKLGRSAIPNLSYSSPHIADKYPAEALKSARSLASSTSGTLYDETNDPQSTDWMIVQSWLVDRMFLAGVPAHCLIADPTHLEPETLRFFSIDRNWIDALLDGALSLGNHSGDDKDRVAIKHMLNDYINHKPEELDHRVQIPTYGFYLRSDLVTMFPDLRVEVLPDDAALSAAGEEAPAGAPLLRHEIVTDGVMMGFMDRVPGSAQFASLVFTQPAHQQRFAVARGLDATEVKVDIRRQYTVDQATRETDKDRHKALKELGPDDAKNIFIWGSEPGKGLSDLRILRLPQFADLQLQTLREGMGSHDGKPYFDDNTATSALFSMQLNDPIYNLTICVKEKLSSKDVAGLTPPGASSSEIRTLKQLGTALVNNFAKEPESKDTLSPWDKSDEYDGTATFRRHKDYTPTSKALARNLAPHIRTLKVLSEASSNVTQNSASFPNVRSVASPPKYNIRVGSNDAKNFDAIMLERGNLAQDLIFSIVLDQNPVNQYRLVELDLQIALPSADATYNTDEFLMSNYTGPGAHMLTNLRFNVLPAIVKDETTEQTSLRLRLLPRSAKGWVDVTKVSELSFLLGLASLNAPTTQVNQLEIQSWADYCIDPDNPKMEPDNTYRVYNPNTLVTVVKNDIIFL